MQNKNLSKGEFLIRVASVSKLTSFVGLRVVVGFFLGRAEFGRDERIGHVEQGRYAFGAVHNEITVHGRAVAIAVVEQRLWKLLGRCVVSENVRGRWRSIHCVVRKLSINLKCRARRIKVTQNHSLV